MKDATKTISYKCSRCNKPFRASIPRDVPVCKECMRKERKEEEKKRNSVVATYKCKDCGKPYDITAGEMQFYRSRGLTSPARCKDCRSKRKQS